MRPLTTAVLALALTGIGARTTAAGDMHHDTPIPAHCTAEAFKSFSAHVWALNHWKRGEPSEKAIQAQRRRLACSRGGHTRVMRKVWRQNRREYYEWRHYMLELRALTPYDCGSHGHFAIPCPVVECESEYRWSAVNPSSGARSVYQMLPSTYYGVCSSCDWSHMDQHRAAGAVWARSGGSEWVCA